MDETLTKSNIFAKFAWNKLSRIEELLYGIWPSFLWKGLICKFQRRCISSIFPQLFEFSTSYRQNLRGLIELKQNSKKELTYT